MPCLRTGLVLKTCTGNIAVGNLHHFLPLIVKMVEHDQEKRLLSLHALKEVGCFTDYGMIVVLTVCAPRL